MADSKEDSNLLSECDAAHPLSDSWGLMGGGGFEGIRYAVTAGGKGGKRWEKLTLVTHFKVKNKGRKSIFVTLMTSERHTRLHIFTPSLPFPLKHLKVANVALAVRFILRFHKDLCEKRRFLDNFNSSFMWSRCQRRTTPSVGWEALIPEKTRRFCVTDDVKQTTEAFSVPVCNPFYAISTVVAWVAPGDLEYNLHVVS